ncbi:hypothetical protein NA57DRAFT_35017, partial [Rhizodiscina lignyota]
ISTMSAWLQKQKKGELQDYAKKIGVADSDEMLKEELVTNIDQSLRANETRFSSDPTFTEFYARSSPVKKDKGTAAAADGEKKPRQRKQSLKVKEEQDAVDSTPDKAKALAARTPRAVQRVASRVPLPPSPAVVTDAIDRQTEIIRRRVSSAWEKSGVDESVEWIREFLSSVEGISLCTLLLEALFLRRETMPWRFAFRMRATPLTPAFDVKCPDFFVLVAESFWGPTLLWLTTSLLAPSAVAYFVNLTKSKRDGVTTRRASKASYPFDPLTFNIAKALISWMVYSQGFYFWGLTSDVTASRVNVSLPAGYTTILIGSGIGILVSLYEAILKK